MKIYLPGPGHDKGPMLKARYEQLRQAGIKRTMSRELTVFLTEGMCAWMHAWLSLPVEITGGSEKGCGTGFNVPGKKEAHFTGIQSEVINILAAISLEKLRGDGICGIC